MSSFDGQRICGVADNIGNVDCQWPFRDISVYAEGRIGQVVLAEAMELALPRWNNNIGTRLAMTANAKTAHIAVKAGAIDGAGRILAQNQLPCGFTPNNWFQLDGLYDNSEAWVISDNPPGDKIDAVRVCCHEIGHGIGIQHISTGNLMAAMYSARISGPQNGDITEGRARYGPPVIVAAPPAAPTQPGIPSSPLPPSTPIDFGVLIRLVAAFGIDLAAKMTPAERAFVIDFVLRMIRSFSPQQRREAAEAMRAAGMPITLD